MMTGVVRDIGIVQLSVRSSVLEMMIFPVKSVFFLSGATHVAVTFIQLPAASPVPPEGLNVHVPQSG